MKRIISCVFLLCLLLIPVTAHASEVESDYISVDFTIGKHDGIAPGDTFSDSVTVTNDSEQTIKARLSKVENIDNSVLYPILTAKLHTDSLFGSFDDLSTDWFTIEPSRTYKLQLDMYFPVEYGNEYQNEELSARFFFETQLPENGTTEPPQTGDCSDLILWMIAGFASFIIMLITFKKVSAAQN